MNKDFKIYYQYKRQIIEKLTYPKFKALITFNNHIEESDIVEEKIIGIIDLKEGTTVKDVELFNNTTVEEVEFIDKVKDPLDSEKAMRELGEFLFNHKLKKNG